MSGGKLTSKKPYVGRLKTVSDWQREIGKIYREMRRGEINPTNGTRLTYVANVGAQLAKIEEELQTAKALTEAFERHQQQGGLLPISEFLPAPAKEEPK
jgi:hypothetical protein